jgi:thiol:disulfide interchange protein DsbC
MRRTMGIFISCILPLTFLFVVIPFGMKDLSVKSDCDNCLNPLSYSQNAFAFGGCEEDCSKCHSLSSDEAKDVLKEIIPDIRVIEVRDAPARGLWEVALKSKGKKRIAYVDFSKENVIIGQIVKIKTKKNLTKERFIELNKIDFSRIPLDDALVMGDRKALNRVVVFDDPD